PPHLAPANPARQTPKTRRIGTLSRQPHKTTSSGGSHPNRAVLRTDRPKPRQVWEIDRTVVQSREQLDCHTERTNGQLAPGPAQHIARMAFRPVCANPVWH